MWKLSLEVEKYLQIEEWHPGVGAVLMDYGDGLGYVPRAHYVIRDKGGVLFFYPGMSLNDEVDENILICFLHALNLTRQGLNAARKVDGVNKMILDAMCRVLITRYGDGIRISVYKSFSVRDYYKDEHGEWRYADHELEKLKTMHVSPCDTCSSIKTGDDHHDKRKKDPTPSQIPYIG